jgi:SSS family solute:Na+ symporter
MSSIIDKIIVAAYFVLVIVFAAGYSRKMKNKETDEEFLTGGHHLNWWQTGLTLIGMMFDPGVMGISALAFTWGFYVIQWNAVNVWVTSWFAGMFFVGIYWRSKIVTTPEYLEKRFNVYSRSFFSLIMAVQLVLLLAYGIYMGAVVLESFLGWDKWICVIVLSVISASYVIFGGMRTMLFMDIIQAVILLITLLAVGLAGFFMLGGFAGIKELDILGKAGTPMNSLLPPNLPEHWKLTNDAYFPMPAILTFAVIAGLSWIICNFSMAQRLLAAKDESHAQKALIMAGGFNVLVLFLAYAAGVAMRKLQPGLTPDNAFMEVVNLKFPVGLKGCVVAGLMAALFSTIDGLIASSSSLLTQDIYRRLFKPSASDKQLKNVNRIIQVLVMVCVFGFIPVFIRYGSQGPVYGLVQEFLGVMLGVLIAIFMLGIFFKRTTARACFIGMIAGVVVGVVLQMDKFLGYGRDMGLVPSDFHILGGLTINFAHVGTIQFIVVMVLGYMLSFFEKPKSDIELENLTVWTLPDVKGPFVGLKAWPALKWWAIGLPVFWILLTLFWELWVR